MSDVMLFGILKMPYELAMSTELSRRQFYDRVQELVARFDAEQPTVKQSLTVEPAQQPYCNDCGGFDPECPLAQPAQQEIEELTAQRDKLADILTRTANALKGQPAELSSHSWHDLPEVAQQIKAAQQQQEPVAYASDVEFDDETEIIPAEQKGKLGTAGLRIPLYIQPPASKPLTDEMDRQAAQIEDYSQRNLFITGWLHAEAAHGIKGDA